MLCNKYIVYILKIAFFALVRILLAFLSLPPSSWILIAVRCDSTLAGTVRVACWAATLAQVWPIWFFWAREVLVSFSRDDSIRMSLSSVALWPLVVCVQSARACLIAFSSSWQIPALGTLSSSFLRSSLMLRRESMCFC